MLGPGIGSYVGGGWGSDSIPRGCTTVRQCARTTIVRSVPDEPEACSDAGFGEDKGGRWPIWSVLSVVRIGGALGEVMLTGGERAGRHRLRTLVASRPGGPLLRA